MTYGNKTKRTLSALLIIGMLAPAFMILSTPKKTKAGVVSCAASIISIVSDLFKKVPKPAGAPVADVTTQGNTGETASNTKRTKKLQQKQMLDNCLKEVKKEMLKGIALRLINKMTQSTVNWINGGFQGKPLFIENSKSFFTDIKKNEVKNFINLVAYDPVKFPFGKNYALGLINETKNTFESNAQYTLSKYTNDAAFLESCRNDFNTCGFDGMLMNIVFPQNNSLGYQIAANEELSKRMTGPGSKVQKIKDDIQNGMGFMSPQVCKSNPNWNEDKLKQGLPNNEKPPYNPPDRFDPAYQADPQTYLDDKNAYDTQWNAQVANLQSGFQKKYGCPEGPAVTTPGSVAADQIMTALSSKQRQGELAIALGNSLSNIFDALLNQLMDKGLNSLTKAVVSLPDLTIDDFNEFGPVSGNYLGNPPLSFDAEMSVNVSINGGTATLSDIDILVDGDLTQPNTKKTYSVGKHIVSATGPNGYGMTMGGDCAADGSINLVLATSKVCDVNFDSNTVARLTVRAVVINDSGGFLTAAMVRLFVDGNPRTNDIEYFYSPGLHTVSQSPLPGYRSIISGDCAPDGSITLAPNDTKTCVIFNNDI